MQRTWFEPWFSGHKKEKDHGDEKIEKGGERKKRGGSDVTIKAVLFCKQIGAGTQK